ncbi:hypothetical protein LT493_10085 [Streptomyces tricolor]|nr:hypothetical protein [Streptomyces tricolor]
MTAPGGQQQRKYLGRQRRRRRRAGRSRARVEGAARRTAVRAGDPMTTALGPTTFDTGPRRAPGTGALGPDPCRRRIAARPHHPARPYGTPGAAPATATRSLRPRLGEAVGSLALVEPGPAPARNRRRLRRRRRRPPAAPPAACAGCQVRPPWTLPHARHPAHPGPRGPPAAAPGRRWRKSRPGPTVAELLDVPAAPGCSPASVSSTPCWRRCAGAGPDPVPCDFKGGVTEWGDPVVTDALAAAEHCARPPGVRAALGSGTFEPLRLPPRLHGKAARW